MSRVDVVLRSKADRDKVCKWVQKVDAGTMVTLKEATRSTDQNSLLWALLSEVARAKPEGRNWTPETWKCAFMHYLGHQVMFAEGLDGSGPFPLGFRSSKLTKKQMTDLIECVLKYGAEHGVVFNDSEEEAA